MSKPPVAAFPIRAPANAEHHVMSRQLGSGSVVVVLLAYPDELPHEEDERELVRRQVEALRGLADSLEQAIAIPRGSA